MDVLLVGAEEIVTEGAKRTFSRFSICVMRLSCSTISIDPKPEPSLNCSTAVKISLVMSRLILVCDNK